MKIGQLVEVQYIPLIAGRSYIHDIRQYENQNFYLVYYRDSDGAIPGWQPVNKLSVVDESVADEQTMYENINYPGCLDKDKSPRPKKEIEKEKEQSWNCFVVHKDIEKSRMRY